MGRGHTTPPGLYFSKKNHRRKFSYSSYNFDVGGCGMLQFDEFEYKNVYLVILIQLLKYFKVNNEFNRKDIR